MIPCGSTDHIGVIPPKKASSVPGYLSFSTFSFSNLPYEIKGGRQEIGPLLLRLLSYCLFHASYIFGKWKKMLQGTYDVDGWCRIFRLSLDFPKFQHHVEIEWCSSLYTTPRHMGSWNSGIHGAVSEGQLTKLAAKACFCYRQRQAILQKMIEPTVCNVCGHKDWAVTSQWLHNDI